MAAKRKLSKKRIDLLREAAHGLIELAENSIDNRVSLPAATLATAMLLAVIESKLPDRRA